MTTAADLDDAGRATVEGYSGASKSRMQNGIRNLDIEFLTFRDTTVLQDTFTKDEVSGLMSGYFDVLKGSLQKHYSESTLAHADVLAQLLKQADQKGKSLSCHVGKTLDTPDLEQTVAALEDELRRKDASPRAGPAQVERPDIDLRKELQSAKDETMRLKEKARDIQEQYNVMMRQKTSVQLELNTELDLLKAIKEVGSTPSDAEIGRMKDEVGKLEAETEEFRKEAKAKLSESSQFQKLQNAMKKKTEEIREMRDRLAKVQAEQPNDDDDED
eukprot:TRINITY_DN5747_c7_g1_i1.p1 TRINITY_DN5747_c7_g1~~TRINITY_DN5747_c7_g1_i1.p1  ORF type:complete len:320 (+),score=149.45 TRINITY_DN5747_c7_g1_i1:144-962(+)